MKNRRTWQSKLTKYELRHLRKQAIASGVQLTLANLKTTFEIHAEMRRKESGLFEPCFLCKHIARKLGFAV